MVKDSIAPSDPKKKNKKVKNFTTLYSNYSFSSINLSKTVFSCSVFPGSSLVRSDQIELVEFEFEFVVEFLAAELVEFQFV